MKCNQNTRIRFSKIFRFLSPKCVALSKYMFRRKKKNQYICQTGASSLGLWPAQRDWAVSRVVNLSRSWHYPCWLHCDRVAPVAWSHQTYNILQDYVGFRKMQRGSISWLILHLWSLLDPLCGFFSIYDASPMLTLWFTEGSSNPRWCQSYKIIVLEPLWHDIRWLDNDKEAQVHSP